MQTLFETNENNRKNVLILLAAVGFTSLINSCLDPARNPLSFVCVCLISFGISTASNIFFCCWIINAASNLNKMAGYSFSPCCDAFLCFLPFNTPRTILYYRLSCSFEHQQKMLDRKNDSIVKKVRIYLLILFVFLNLVLYGLLLGRGYLSVAQVYPLNAYIFDEIVINSFVVLVGIFAWILNFVILRRLTKQEEAVEKLWKSYFPQNYLLQTDHPAYKAVQCDLEHFYEVYSFEDPCSAHEFWMELPAEKKSLIARTNPEVADVMEQIDEQQRLIELDFARKNPDVQFRRIDEEHASENLYD